MVFSAVFWYVLDERKACSDVVIVPLVSFGTKHMWNCAKTSRFPWFKTVTKYEHCYKKWPCVCVWESSVGVVLTVGSSVAPLHLQETGCETALNQSAGDSSSAQCLTPLQAGLTALDQPCFLPACFPSTLPVWTGCHNNRPFFRRTTGDIFKRLINSEAKGNADYAFRLCVREQMGHSFSNKG